MNAYEVYTIQAHSGKFIADFSNSNWELFSDTTPVVDFDGGVSTRGEMHTEAILKELKEFILRKGEARQFSSAAS